ncbi:N-acetyl-alpha-D-glucosaminyl L-malate synthase [Arenibacter algicola]|uniref:N-acetyl-alpha-D-glucosaminyl L-malate synthase n=2 Tax=Arenibacter algicola TaxID=616991 RepID=A0A221UU62_9FLAO|nr:N-acetyl-alpha-D-glucosaminyl L-malate synthase [Arenibacter algicola]
MNDENIGSIASLNRAIVDGLANDFEFIPLNIIRKYGKSKLSKFNILNIFYFLKQYVFLIYQVLKHKPDVVHYSINSNWSLEKSLLFLNTAKIFGANKAIGHLHGGAFDVFMDNMNTFRKKVSLALFSNLDLVIVASSFWKDYLNRNGVNSRIEIVNNPIDLKYISRINNISNNNRNENFLFIGSLGKRKGVYDIIEVCRTNIGEFKIDLIGSEDKTNDLRKISSLIQENKLESKINLIISEKLSLIDKVRFFTENRVFLFPSHNENFPLVIIEAACAGIPIITTPVGAVPEFFTHLKNIYFIEPGNIEEIIGAIRFMQTNEVERDRLGKAARHTYETKLSDKIVMSQLKNVYNTL